MNRVELRQWFLRLVQRSILPAEQVSIDTAELDQLVFEACCKMATAARPVHLRAETTISLNGDESYSLPTDFLSFFDLEPVSIGGTQLVKRTKGELDSSFTGWRDDESGDAAFYYEAGVPTFGALDGTRTIGFHPNPTSGTATVPYVRKPRLLSALTADTSEFADIPAEFQRAPIYEAAAEWGEVAGIPEAVTQGWRNKFGAELRRYIALYGEKQQRDYRPTVAVANVWMALE